MGFRLSAEKTVHLSRKPVSYIPERDQKARPLLCWTHKRTRTDSTRAINNNYDVDTAVNAG